MAAKLAKREVSSREAMQDCLDQVQRVEKRVRAFLSFDAADALVNAAEENRLEINVPLLATDEVRTRAARLVAVPKALLAVTQ